MTLLKSKILAWAKKQLNEDHEFWKKSQKTGASLFKKLAAFVVKKGVA